MKKIINILNLCICIIIILSISGCSLSNTPTMRVEKFLNSYKQGDDKVIKELDEMVKSDTLMNENQKRTYTDIIKNQYKDITYDIKNEKINGNKATVTAEIEVYDFYKANKEAEEYYNNNKSEFEINNDSQKENENESVKEKVEDAVDTAKEGIKDTVEGIKEGVDNTTDELTRDSKYIDYRLDRLKSTKDRIKYTIDFNLTKKDSSWVLEDIDDITRQKIHGLYEH